MSPIPMIDIGRFEAGDVTQRSRLGELVDSTFRDIGFMIITDHGVAPKIATDAEHAARAFFDLPPEQKRRVTLPQRGRGYVPFGEASSARGQGQPNVPADIREAFIVGSPRIESTHARWQTVEPNVWPDEPQEFRTAIERYYREMEQLAFRLLRLFAVALRLPEAYFDNYYREHNCTQRVLHYPPIRASKAGQFPISAHTDVGAFAIVGVSEADGQGRLQVLDKTKKWIDVGAPEGSLVVNIGDLLKMWTNDRWDSTLHRVSNPLAESPNPTARLSIAFHANPTPDALIEALATCVTAVAPARHAPVLAGEYRLKKIARSNPATIGKTLDDDY